MAQFFDRGAVSGCGEAPPGWKDFRITRMGTINYMAQFSVLFDMDGLMLDTERMARVAWTRALAERGYQIGADSYLRLIGRTIQDAHDILNEEFGSDLPFQEIFDQRQVYYEEDIEENGIPAKPGLMELLDFLEANAIVKAVASSTPFWFAQKKLAHVKIDRRFSTIVCGDMVSRGKPAPDLFLECARRIETLPECCIVLEDSEAGIQGAYSAGMIPIMVPDLKPPTESAQAMAFRVLPSLYEVIPILENFLRDGLPAARKI